MASHTFEVSDASVDGVLVRYRFITEEVPGGFYGSQFNDYYSVVVRGQNAGSVVADSRSMNSFPLSAYNLNGSTTWMEIRLDVEPVETVQVDLLVANARDDYLQSYVVVDFVEEV